MTRIIALALGAAALCTAVPAGADEPFNPTCAQLMVIRDTPDVGARVWPMLVVEAMRYMNDHHVRGENVTVDLKAMTPVGQMNWMSAYCKANPNVRYRDAAHALYDHLAELSTPTAAGAIPPPPQGTPPGVPPPPAPGLFPPSGNATITAVIKDASTEPLEDLEKNIEHLHPAAMIILAKRLEEAGRHDDALFWFSEGTIRWMAYVFQSRDMAEQNAFERISSGAGVEINRYPARDAERLRAAIDKALAWDESHPDPFTPPGPAKENARKLLEGIKAQAVARPDELARENAEAQQQSAASPDDPYSGSGGAMFGTPQELVPAYNVDKFAQFKIGVTTKKDVVAALGAPEMWFTDKDGSSTLSYPVQMTHNAMAAIGLVRRANVRFTFDANRVLTKIDLPQEQ